MLARGGEKGRNYVQAIEAINAVIDERFGRSSSIPSFVLHQASGDWSLDGVPSLFLSSFSSRRRP